MKKADVGEQQRQIQAFQAHLEQYAWIYLRTA